MLVRFLLFGFTWACAGAVLQYTYICYSNMGVFPSCSASFLCCCACSSEIVVLLSFFSAAFQLEMVQLSGLPCPALPRLALPRPAPLCPVLPCHAAPDLGTACTCDPNRLHAPELADLVGPHVASRRYAILNGSLCMVQVRTHAFAWLSQFTWLASKPASMILVFSALLAPTRPRPTEQAPGCSCLRVLQSQSRASGGCWPSLVASTP